MTAYETIPLTIEAKQWTGDNWSEINEWSEGAFSNNPSGTPSLGGLRVRLGDYIVRGLGPFYSLLKAAEFESRFRAI